MKKEKAHAIVQKKYKDILNLVEKGLSISEAVDHCGINRGTFYNYLTDLQKVEIYHAKKLQTRYGVGSVYTNQ